MVGLLSKGEREPDQSWELLQIVSKFASFSDDQGFGSGSGSGSGVFAWIRIRIRFSNFLDPVSAKTLKNCRKVSKSDLSEENLKFMTKDRQKMKKATISY